MEEASHRDEDAITIMKYAKIDDAKVKVDALYPCPLASSSSFQCPLVPYPFTLNFPHLSYNHIYRVIDKKYNYRLQNKSKTEHFQQTLRCTLFKQIPHYKNWFRGPRSLIVYWSEFHCNKVYWYFH